MKNTHPRSGAQELTNFTGAASSEDKANAALNLVTTIASSKQIGERYSGTMWDRSSVLAGDEGFQQLRAAIDDAAAVSDSVRKERDAQFRKQYGAIASTAATFGGPYGVAAAAVLTAMAESMMALSKFMDSAKVKKDAAARDRAVKGVRRLWDNWRILPPTLDLEAGNIQDFANRVDGLNEAFDNSERTGDPWRAEWVATMDGIPNYKLPIAQDASRFGWIPIDGYVWLGNGYMKDDKGKFYWKGLGTKSSDLKFGQKRTVTKTPGFLSAERKLVIETIAPTLKELTDFTDKYAAGVGAIVAARYDVAPEPVIEAAVDANRKYAEAIGPSPHLQGYRLKGVFEKAVEAAKKAPRNPVLALKGSAFKLLASTKSAPQTVISSLTTTTPAAEAPKKGMTTMVKVSIGVGAAVILAAGGYYLYRRSSRGGVR